MRLDVPAQVVRGFCMGAADLVPGVSGGTIALVFGIYERLVHQVKEAALAGARFLRLDPRDGFARLSRLDWGFVLPLLAGIALAVLTLSHLLANLLETRPIETAAVFFGLVAASVAVAAAGVRRWDVPRCGVLLAVAVATFLALGWRKGPAPDPSLLLVLAAGAVAVCAMILPGVSGSFLLLMLGMYQYVLDAVNERDLVVVAVFVVGAVIGLAAFSSLLDRALRTHRDTVMAALVGLMAGSLRVLWPWPGGTDSAALDAPPVAGWVSPLVLAIVAAVVVLGVAGLARDADAPSSRAGAGAR